MWQDDEFSIFSRESRTKPSFVTIASWVGGRLKVLCESFALHFLSFQRETVWDARMLLGKINILL